MQNNMRVGVAALLFDENRAGEGTFIAMGRRGKDPNRGLFVLPGGGVEDGETLEQALIREIKEETGQTIKEVVGPWFVIELTQERRLVLVARAFTWDQKLVAGSDLYDVQWIETDHLPADTSPAILPFLEKQMDFRVEGKRYPSNWL